MPKLIRQRQKKRNLILLSTLAVIILAGGLYFLFARGPTSGPAMTGSGPGLEPPSSQAEPPAELPPPAEEEAEPHLAEASPAAAEDSCLQSAARVSDFFSSLDRRPYIAFYEFEGGSERHFAGLVKKLAAHPPVVVRETDSLFTILQNTAHFYRVLGRDNLFLIKDILESETEIFEPAIADLYRWSLAAGNCGQEPPAIAMPLAGLYEYAGFFLNTLGGQSYLFRRAPLVRTLTKYYSVLIVDRAEEQGLNTHGIDVRPVIDGLIIEMEALRNLASREKYLRTLRNLQGKYQARYGG
jgi:hypothetical protein